MILKTEHTNYFRIRNNLVLFFPKEYYVLRVFQSKKTLQFNSCIRKW